MNYNIFFFIFIFFHGGLFCVIAQLPVNNPYLDKYSNCPPWLNEIRWNNVVDVTAFSNIPNPASWDSAVNAAMDYISGSGGGVVFFPAGTYIMKDTLRIKDRVVLRGATPANLNAKSNQFAPPSRLAFPGYVPSFTDNGTPNSTAFRMIYFYGLQNAGLVYLDINRAGIRVTTRTEGTDVIYSRNIIIFGVRQNNVAIPQSDIPSGYSYMHGWQRFSYRHATNILVNVTENITITNCRLNDFTNNAVYPITNDSYDQPGYVARCRYNGSIETPNGAKCGTLPIEQDTTHIMHGERARFSYTDHYGIRVSGKFVDPDTVSKTYRQFIDVIDNYVYTTMRVGIFVTGYGATVKGNIREDDNNKRIFLHPTGVSLNSNNSATYENRALNIAGHHILVDSNDMRVYRHRLSYTAYSSVDGEGVLMQTQDMYGSFMENIVITNNTVNSYIGLYDLQYPMRNLIISKNNLLNAGTVLVFKKEYTHRIDELYIEDNVNLTGISVGYKISNSEYRVTGNNIYIRNNSGSGNMNYPCQAIQTGNTGFTDLMSCSGGLNEKYFFKPYYGEINVSSSTEVSVEFTRTIKAGGATNITITGETTGAVGGISRTVFGNKLIINHNVLNNPGEKYTVFVPADAVRDSADNTPSVEMTWWFKVMTKPAPVMKYPSDSATGIDADEDVLIQFGQDVTVISLTGITITDEQGNPVVVNPVFNPSSNTIAINHADFEKALHYYTVHIPAGVVQNASGFTNNQVSWAFKTHDIILQMSMQIQTPQVKMYPNPVINALTIEKQGNLKQVYVKVYDLLGNIVHVGSYPENSFDIDFTALPTGMYIVKIDNSQASVSRKVVKK